MKKSLSLLLLCLVLATIMLSLSSCDIIDNLLNKSSNPNIKCALESSFIEGNDPYRIVDSFALDDEHVYYIFNLGTIDNVPLNISGAEGVYFNGNDMDLEFKYKETNKTESSSLVENTIENSVELKTSTYTKGSVSVPLMTIFEAGVEVGTEQSLSTGITTTFKESYYNAVSKETTFEKNVTYKMDKKNPVGYYFYTPIASVRVYEVVLYNPVQEKIEYMFTYNQLGEALPGLFYSKVSFLDLSKLQIEFDESRMPTLTTPTKVLDKNLTISVDSAGAICDTESLDLVFGETYGTLPKPTRQGYTFAGWSCNGVKIDSSSTVLSTEPIVAEWELVTKITIPINANIEVSSTYKLNPFGLLIPGYDGASSSKGLDIQDYFDFETLKKEGYKMNIIFKSDVKNNVGAVFGLEYDVIFYSNGSKVCKLHDEIKTTSYKTRTLHSNKIPLEMINGNVNFTVETENVFSLYMKNISIQVEFTK